MNKRRANVKIPKNFGDIATRDHVYAHSETMEGITGDKDLLVVYDLATDFLAAYAVKGET